MYNSKPNARKGEIKVANKRQRRKLEKQTLNFIIKNKDKNLGYVLPTTSEYKRMTRTQKNFYNEKIRQLQHKQEWKRNEALGGIILHGAKYDNNKTGLSRNHAERIRNVGYLTSSLSEFIRPLEDEPWFRNQAKDLYSDSQFNRRDFRYRNGMAFNNLPENEVREEYEDRVGKQHNQHVLDTSNEYIKEKMRTTEIYEASDNSGVIEYDPNEEARTSGRGRMVSFYSGATLDDVERRINRDAFNLVADEMLRAGPNEKWGDKGALDLFS